MKNNNAWLTQYSKNYFSQNGEDGILEKALEIIGKTDKWCVEFGAWDGIFHSNTHHLISQKGYSAVLIEGDSEKFKSLKANYANNSKVTQINTFVGFNNTDSLDAILAGTSIPPGFDLLSIDIDGNDYHIWNALSNYKPKLVVIEFNPTIPDEVEFVQEKSPDINHGNSILSLRNLAKQKGYQLIATTLNNAIFVDEKYFSLFNIHDNSIAKLRQDKSRVTYIFNGYDGTIFIRGYGKVDLHGIPYFEQKMQLIPKFLRQWNTSSKFKRFLTRIHRSLKKRKII
jgi:hypothetical protein